MSMIAPPVLFEPFSLHVSKPRFLGIVGSEIFKVRHMLSIWISLVLMLGAVCLPTCITLTVKRQANSLKTTPLHFFYSSVPLNLAVLRIFIGFFLLILTASVFGSEYQFGTVRILLARGVGRVQLLYAKLLAVLLIALVVFALGLLLVVLLQGLQMIVMAGNFDGLKALDADFWQNSGIYVLTILVSIGTTILLATALTALGRSYVFGLSASLAFFPTDNIGNVFMMLGYRLTGNIFWKDSTAYLLGPNLNRMPAALVPAHFEGIGSSPLVAVDGTHTLVVALVYALIFIVSATILTWKRDVKE